MSDGDTIIVLVNRQQVKVRLAGIDCPEKSQDFGSKAKQFTAALVFAQPVTIVSYGCDRYGRTIAEVFGKDGTNLNKGLLQSGLAWWYREYSDDPQLERLEAEARSKKIGLWSLPNREPPWCYRRQYKRRKFDKSVSESDEIRVLLKHLFYRRSAGVLK